MAKTKEIEKVRVFTIDVLLEASDLGVKQKSSGVERSRKKTEKICIENLAGFILP